jgi:ferredoxin
MKITLNPAACDGFGFCAEALPELVDLDEWGFPVIRATEIPPGLRKNARQAVRICPRKALALVEAAAASTGLRR